MSFAQITCIFTCCKTFLFKQILFEQLEKLLKTLLFKSSKLQRIVQDSLFDRASYQSA